MVARGSPRDRFQHDVDFHVALLHLAVKEDDILAIKDLMRVPDWIHAADKSGRNALHWVVAFGSKDACELLLSRTGEEGIHHADKTGRTPLHLAAIWGRSDVAKIILARGANVNAHDNKGMTALHYAAQNSNPFLIRSLIKRGADKQARDTKRRIPYQVAVNWGSPEEILDLLDPDFSPGRAQKVLEMPQARRFAESLSPKGLREAMPVPPVLSSSNTEHPAELVKYEMQRQSDKTRNSLRKVVVRKLKKWERPIAHSKDYALKALAARRRKLFVEHEMKKTRETKRMQQIKKESSAGKPSGSWSSPPVTFALREEKDSAVSRSGSKTPTGTKSSQSSSPTAIKRPAKGIYPPTYSRPNSPNAPVQFYRAKPIRPNPSARDGWPSPPGSIREGKGGRRPKAILTKGKRKKTAKPSRRPILTPSPARLALSEFVGTSARHNALGMYRSPKVHKCIDIQKLKNQWL